MKLTNHDRAQLKESRFLSSTLNYNFIRIKCETASTYIFKLLNNISNKKVYCVQTIVLIQILLCKIIACSKRKVMKLTNKPSNFISSG